MRRILVLCFLVFILGCASEPVTESQSGISDSLDGVTIPPTYTVHHTMSSQGQTVMERDFTYTIENEELVLFDGTWSTSAYRYEGVGWRVCHQVYGDGVDTCSCENYATQKGRLLDTSTCEDKVDLEDMLTMSTLVKELPGYPTQYNLNWDDVVKEENCFFLQSNMDEGYNNIVYEACFEEDILMRYDFSGAGMGKRSKETWEIV